MIGLSTFFDIPRIPRDRLPEGEREAGWFVQNHLMSMQTHLSKFHRSIQLFQYAEAEMQNLQSVNYLPENREAIDKLWSWQIIAADHGAMDLYHFVQSIRNVFGDKTSKKFVCALDLAPTLRSLVGDVDVHSFLKDRLPDFWSVRNGVAHVEENMNIEKIDEHRVDGIFGASNMENNKYWFTVKGRRCEYEVSQITTSCMREIASDVVACVRKASFDLAQNSSQL